MSRRVVAVLFVAVALPSAAIAQGAAAPDAAAPAPAVAPAPPDGAIATPALATPALATPAKLDPKKLIAPAKTPELLEKGRLAFLTSCVVCHGEGGKGDGPAGQVLNPRPRDFTKDAFKQGGKPAELFVTISEGVKDTPMVGFAHLTEEERWGLSYHVLTLAPAKGKAKAK